MASQCVTRGRDDADTIGQDIVPSADHRTNRRSTAMTSHNSACECHHDEYAHRHLPIRDLLLRSGGRALVAEAQNWSRSSDIDRRTPNVGAGDA